MFAWEILNGHIPLIILVPKVSFDKARQDKRVRDLHPIKAEFRVDFEQCRNVVADNVMPNDLSGFCQHLHASFDLIGAKYPSL